jgi:hypothetical protein
MVSFHWKPELPKMTAGIRKGKRSIQTSSPYAYTADTLDKAARRIQGRDAGEGNPGRCVKRRIERYQ